MRHKLNRTLALLLFSSGILTAQTTLWSDSFDTTDDTNFDLSSTEGRIAGTFAAETYLQSTRNQQEILNNQLYTRGAGGLRFENASNDPGAEGNMDHFDWAAGAPGAAILAANGFTVSFDWTPENNIDPQWISWNVGHPNADTNFRITQPANDYGVLLRNDGRSERWDNGANQGAGGNFTTAPGGGQTYAVSISFSLSSFAEGENVTAVTTVDGAEVANDIFQWDGNGGQIHMEFFTNKTANLIDNLTIATSNTSVYSFTLDGDSFGSAGSQGSDIGILTGLLDGTSTPSTFSLTNGEGDIDNDKFQITGDRLQIGTFDFTGDNSTNGQEFNVRISASNDSGPQTEERSFVLRVVKDDDNDDLVDDWENLWAGNLNDLSGDPGTSDFDNDGLSDLEEFQLSNGSYPERAAYPDINPTDDDTDKDTLKDG